MDDKIYELARTQVNAFTRELSPHYQEIRQHMIGELAVTNGKLRDLELEDRLDHNNCQMLAEVTGVLPAPTTSADPHIKYGDARTINYRFQTQQEADIRPLQASVIWLKTSTTYYPNMEASRSRKIGVCQGYYVVGDNKSRKKSRREMLLVPHPDASPPITFSDEAEWDSDLKSLFEKSSSEVLRYRPGRKVRKSYQEAVDRYPVPIKREEIKAHMIKDEYHIEIGAHSPGSVLSHEYFLNRANRITIDDIAAYQIMEHLGDLGLRFGVSQKIDAVLRKYQEKARQIKADF